MKQTVAVSLTLQQLASFINDSLAAAAGDTVPWALVLQTDGVAQYVANTSRDDGQKLIESLLDRWRAGRADIPAHYNPDLAKPAEDEAPKAEPVTLPRVYGVGRDAEYPRALLVDFDRVPTDDELRALHELVRSTPPPQPVELSDAGIIAIRDEHLPAQGEPFDFIAFARTVMAQGRKG